MDPPAGVDGDSCGIVVCALRHDGIAVLADLCVGGALPEAWARKVAGAAAAWGAHWVVAERTMAG